MSTALPARAGWRPDIEGLRGLAVLLVVCFHAGIPAFRGAFVAVDVFFVLSGFFLTSALTRDLVEHDRLAITQVIARRAWRLIPAVVVMLIVTLLSAMWLYAPIDRVEVARHAVSVGWFASNITFASGGVNYFSAGENPLLHTWTLGVELQLVVMFTLLVAVLARIGRKRASIDAAAFDRRMTMMRTVLSGIAVVGGVSFALSLWLNDVAPMWSYFGPHTRLWSFAVGASVAFIAGAGQSVFGAATSRIAVAQIVGVVAIIAPALLFDRTASYPGLISLVPVTGTVLLLSGGALATQTAVGGLLARPALQWLGRHSFAWYLWHWPPMVLGSVLVPGMGPLGRLLCAVIGLALAVVAARFVERPLREWWTTRASTGPPWLAAFGVSIALTAFALIVGVYAERAAASPQQQVFASAREDRADHECWVRSIDEAPRGACAFGAPRATTTLALLGDSHAEHWLGGLERAGAERNWRIDVHVMGGCPVSDLSALAIATSSRMRECTRYREAMIREIIRQRPRAVVLSNFDDYMRVDSYGTNEHQVNEAAWTAGLRRTYTRFHRAGIPVVVLRGTPRVPFDVPTCLSRQAAQLLWSSDCRFTPNRAFMARAQRAQDVAARGLNVRFIDMNDVVCPTVRCTTQRHGLVVFKDDNHLTASFTRSLAPVLGHRLANALGGD